MLRSLVPPLPLLFFNNTKFSESKYALTFCIKFYFEAKTTCYLIFIYIGVYYTISWNKQTKITIEFENRLSNRYKKQYSKLTFLFFQIRLQLSYKNVRSYKT